MNLRPFLPIASILVLAGCASPEDGGETSIGALEETPRITAAELAAKAEARYDEVEGATQAPDGKTTIVFAIDDGAPVQVEGDQIDVKVPLGSWDTEQMTKLTAKSDPVFYVQRAGAYTVGAAACKDVKGGVVIVKGEERFRPSPDQPCTIAITKVYAETLDPHVVSVTHARPRTIVVGEVSAVLTSEAGATLDVRGGFVLPTKPN